MAESKFTPGPWSVQKSEAYKNTWRITADGQRLASLDGDDGEPEEIEANAELMADAPRLLEVLRTLCYGSKPIMHTEDTLEGYRQAREILQKHGG